MENSIKKCFFLLKPSLTNSESQKNRGEGMLVVTIRTKVVLSVKKKD